MQDLDQTPLTPPVAARDPMQPFRKALVKKLRAAAVISLGVTLLAALQHTDTRPLWEMVTAAGLWLWTGLLAGCTAFWTGLCAVFGFLWRAPAYASVLPLSLWGFHVHIQYWQRSRWRRGVMHLGLERSSIPKSQYWQEGLSSTLQWLLTPLAMASTLYFADERPLAATLANVVALVPAIALIRAKSDMSLQIRPLEDEGSAAVPVYLVALLAGGIGGAHHGPLWAAAGVVGMVVLSGLAKLPPCPVFLATEDESSGEPPRVLS